MRGVPHACVWCWWVAFGIKEFGSWVRGKPGLLEHRENKKGEIERIEREILVRISIMFPFYNPPSSLIPWIAH